MYVDLEKIDKNFLFFEIESQRSVSQPVCRGTQVRLSNVPQGFLTNN